jgi:hypothetical protein
VKIARLSPDGGGLLDPAGIVVASSPGNSVAVSLTPALGSTLVAWSDNRKIVANTVNHDGVLGSMPVIVTPPDVIGTRGISAAWNGHEWLIAWEDLVPSPIPVDPAPVFNVRIFAARLSSSLGLLDPKPIVISSTPNARGGPLAASNGDGFLIVWSYADPTLPFSSVFAQRVSSDGSQLAPSGGVRLAGGIPKSVVWDGLQYDVALSSHTPNGQVVPYDLFVTHVAAGGAIESLNPLAVISNSIDPYASLFVTGIGHTSTVYTRVGTEPQYGDVERAFVSIPHLVRGRAAR